MRVEDDGHLCLGISDLSPKFRDSPPERLCYTHFRYEARIAGWYAVQLAPLWFVMPGRLEIIADQDREDLPHWSHL